MNEMRFKEHSLNQAEPDPTLSELSPLMSPTEHITINKPAHILLKRIGKVFYNTGIPPKTKGEIYLL